jgi:hypothetical protein
MKLTAMATLAALSAPAVAGQLNGAVFFSSIPALDEVGLGLLIALVAGVAGWAVRRRGRR